MENFNIIGANKPEAGVCEEVSMTAGYHDELGKLKEEVTTFKVCYDEHLNRTFEQVEPPPNSSLEKPTKK